MTEEGESIPRSALRRASDGRLATIDWRRMLAQDVRQDVRKGVLPGLLLVLALVGLFVVERFNGGPIRWGLSRQALGEGRWYTLASHVVTHAGVAHLWMNSSALLTLTPPIRQFTGMGVRGWVRFFLLFIGAAISSAAAYLLLHPNDGLPMVGASGAICGLWGAAVRMDSETEQPRVLKSRLVLRGIRDFAVSNLILFALLFVLARASGASGGLAWEAHLGGFLFGLLAAPILFRNVSPSEPAATSSRGA